MNILKDKQTKTYQSGLSRYASVPFYYNTVEDKYVYGLTQHLSDKTQYTIHTLKPYDTLESLAQYYYGRPDYYWIIADFNRLNPFIDLYENLIIIKIPSISYIYFGAVRWQQT